jgi:hypothetical protein
LRKSKSPENSFTKILSALFRYLPKYSVGRAPKEKPSPFSFFKRNFTPAKSKMQEAFFLLWLPRPCEAVAERFIRRQDWFQKTLPIEFFKFINGEGAFWKLQKAPLGIKIAVMAIL